MKKLLLLAGIVSLFLSCDNTDMENQEVKQEAIETVELKEPKPVTNVRHTRNGDVYTVCFEHDGDGVIGYDVSIGCTNGYAGIQKEYLKLTPDAREFTFDNAELNTKIPCTHTDCKKIVSDIHVHYDTQKYSSFNVTTLYRFDYS
jgi:hypothetical protein